MGGSENKQQWACEIQLLWSEDEFSNQAANTPHPMGAEPISQTAQKDQSSTFSPAALPTGKGAKEKAEIAYANVP